MKAGGSFPALNDSFLSPECAQEISDYFASDDGQYFVDVARVTERARRHFEDLSDSDPPSSKKVIVFDIDETTLSNAAEWQKAFLNRIGHRRGWTWRLRLQFPMLLGDLLLEKAPLGASDRPPLAPMLGLYHYLYSSGYRQGLLCFIHKLPSFHSRNYQPQSAVYVAATTDRNHHHQHPLLHWHQR